MSKARAVRTRSLPIQYTSTPVNGKDLSPLIIMSGYLTKKARGLGNRWLRRWWQLLGDGTLIYFKGEERLKVLGEVDIAHTCYDVQLGAEHCSIDFPAIVPSNCCFSVSVLKRTFYFFAPSPIEAKKWSTMLSSVSYILNRTRPRNLSANPAKQIASEETENLPPTPPILPPPPSSHKAPPPPPPLNSSSVSSEGDDEPCDLPSFHDRLLHAKHQHLSVPDLRYDFYQTPELKLQNVKSKSTKLSPSQFSHSSTSPSEILQSRSSSSYQHQRSSSLDRTKQYSANSQVDTSGVILRRNLKKENNKKSTQKRSSLTNNWHASHSDLVNNWFEPTSTLPSAGKLNRSKWRSEFINTTAIDPTFDKLERLQKQEEEIRKKLRNLQKSEGASTDISSKRIPLTPTDNFSFPELSDYLDHSKIDVPSQQENISNINIKTPRKPPRVAPKPIKRHDTPYTSVHQENNESETENGQSPVVAPNTEADTLSYQGNNYKSPAIRAYEANVWVKAEMNKVYYNNDK